MNRELLSALVENVRKRASEGDCPLTPAYPVETLENAIIDLADKPLYATPTSADADKLLKALRDHGWDLRCFDVPTGGGDCDIGWRVIGHWQAEPRERTIAEVFVDDPAEAIRQALARLSTTETTATPADAVEGEGS